MRREKSTIGISVTIQNLKTLKDLDKSLFERFYLGYPYCLEKAGSFLIEIEHLQQAINELKNLDKQAFLVTPAILQNKDLELVENVIEKAVTCGLDGIEVNDVGMFSVAKRWPQLKILAGFFTNIYHSEAALEYIKEGATTVLAHSELMFEEIKEIGEEVHSAQRTMDSARSEVGIIVYGNLPLGAVYDCYLKMVDPENKCRQQCAKPYVFKHTEFSMRNVGRANVMANDFCLLEHIEKLKEINANYWRLETSLCSAEKINTVGRAFIECTNGADPADYIDSLKELAPQGLCDGWFLGKPGHSYNGSEQQVSPFVKGGLRGISIKKSLPTSLLKREE